MESIYNPTIFQRIVDHFGIGRLLKITRLDNVSTNIWRHQLETRRGVFEVYSSPNNDGGVAVEKLTSFITTQLNIKVDAKYLPICHSFDRHHRLLMVQIPTKSLLNNSKMILAVSKTKNSLKRLRVSII